MATTAIENVEQHPAVVAARHALDPIAARARHLRERYQRAVRLTSYRNEYTNAAAVVATADEVAQAQIDRPQLEIEVRRVELEATRAERTLADARSIARADVSAHVDVERKKVVQRLDRKLREAEAVNAELVALDERATAVGGNFAAMAAWPELLAETPTHQPRISCWRALMRTAGLLD